MDDSKIIDLFFERSEKAIVELSNKYGSVCLKVSMNILNNYHEAEECANDSYLGVLSMRQEDKSNARIYSSRKKRPEKLSISAFLSVFLCLCNATV